MPANAKQIAKKLGEIATLLELRGDNPFRIRAYSNAVRILENSEVEIDDFIEQATKGEVKGIGATLAQHITALHNTGTDPFLEELRAEFPESLLEILNIPGLGSKKVKVLYEQLKIQSIDELRIACEKDKLSALKGFGKKTQQKILAGIERYKTYSSQFLFKVALEQAEPLVEALRASDKTAQIEIAGSIRRRKEVVKDIDIIATSSSPKTLMKTFISFAGVQTVTAHGETKSSVVLDNGIAVDLRVVSEKEYPTALLHFTGSKEHNTTLRRIAQKHGWKLNEYGLFKDEKPFSLKSEEEIHNKLGLCFIPPELREDQGEVDEAASFLKEETGFPRLVELGDVKGVIHAHTTYSDGQDTLEKLATAVKKLGYRYLGVSDHSQSAAYAGGLKLASIRKQHAEIDRLNEKLSPFVIFKGIESDILEDGQLDYPDKVLAQFDFIVASVHSRFSMDEARMTRRIIAAVNNPFTTILGHPTGRLLLKREPYPVNINAVLEAAANSGTAVEINANSLRLDLDWRYVKKARALGIPLPVCPDAHSIEQVDNIRYGIYAARKGGATKEDILTCWDLNKVKAFFRKKKA